MSRENKLLCLALAIAVVGICAKAAQAESAEPICSTANALFCDDFEDGSWWITAEDENDPQNDGWLGGVFFPSDPNGTNYVRCGDKSRTGGGAGGTNCAATSMVMTDTMGAGANGRFGIPESDEFYVRYYWWVSPNYRYGHQKGLGFEKSLHNSHFEYGQFHHPFQSGRMSYLTDKYDATGAKWYHANKSSSLMTMPGWYLFEGHIKLNTPGRQDGTLRAWLNHCGDAADCPKTMADQTLIMEYSGVSFRGDQTAGVRSFYWNNWSNFHGQGSTPTAPPSNGEMYYDQIVVSKKRIGPMLPAVSEPPPPPPSPCDGDLNGDGIVLGTDFAMAWVMPWKWPDVIRWFGQRCVR